MEAILLLAVVATVVLLVIGLAVVYQLILQNGRILLRLEFLEQIAAPWDDRAIGVEEYVATLPRGVPAPPIQLPDLDGIDRNLSEWRGQRVLLVFVDPNCGFSRSLVPSLVALVSDVVPGRPLPVFVTTGTVDENREFFEETGFASQVLVQAGTEVAAAYKVDGTPMSYLVDIDGTIASEIAVGVQGILILAGDMASITDATTSTVPGGISPAPASALESTVRLRDGLRAGATAPVFRLPRIDVDAGDLSLLDYRGREVVLVFFDPECAPCDALAPLLETAYRDMSGSAALLMISRGDPEATRAKVAEHGLSFPIAFQRHWEISREYGIFATPAAFLIDEWGVISADVAVGNDDVIRLIGSVARRSET